MGLRQNDCVDEDDVDDDEVYTTKQTNYLMKMTTILLIIYR